MILYFIRWFFMQHYIFYRKIILAHPVSEMVFQIERLAILVTDSDVAHGIGTVSRIVRSSLYF